MPPNAPQILAVDENPENITVIRVLGTRGVVAEGTGSTPGTGIVTVSLENIPSVSGKWFSRVLVDIHGRVVDGVEGQEQDFNPADFIWNQTAGMQNANFSVASGQVVNLSVQTLSLTNPLGVPYGGTGASTTSQGYVFIGPASSSGPPGFRRLVASDLPSELNSYIWNNPLSQQSASFDISGYGSVAALELNYDNPADTANKIYRVGSTLYWNGSPVASNYLLPVASPTILGGIKVGSGLSILPDGTLNSLSSVLSLNNLTDVVITAPAEDQVLVYQSGMWVNVPVSGIPTLETYIATKAQELLDAQLPTAIANYLLTVSGQPNGLATLGPTGKVPNSQLPDSVVGGGDKEYVHTQSTPAFIWTVVHNLGTYPTVSCMDNTVLPIQEFEGEVDYVDLNTLTVTFNELSVGIAVCR